MDPGVRAGHVCEGREREHLQHLTQHLANAILDQRLGSPIGVPADAVAVLLVLALVEHLLLVHPQVAEVAVDLADHRQPVTPGLLDGHHHPVEMQRGDICRARQAQRERSLRQTNC